MQNPFLITRLVFFGKSAFEVAKILVEISLSVPALLVNINLLSIIFTSWNINATLTNGLPSMDIVDRYAMINISVRYSTCRPSHLSVRQLYYSSMHHAVRLTCLKVLRFDCSTNPEASQNYFFQQLALHDCCSNVRGLGPSLYFRLVGSLRCKTYVTHASLQPLRSASVCTDILYVGYFLRWVFSV